MKSPFTLLLGVLLLGSIFYIYNFCFNCPECPDPPVHDEAIVENVTNDFFVKGKVIIPATEAHPVGVIRIFINEDIGEYKKLKGVIYKRQAASSLLKKYDKVFCKVVEKDGVQFAIDIVTTIPELSELWQYQTSYTEFSSYSLELHTEDSVTDQFHNKIHIIKRIELSSSHSYVVTENENDSDLDTIYIRNIDLQQVNFNSNNEVIDSNSTDNLFYRYLAGRTISGIPIYGISKEHVHDHE